VRDVNTGVTGKISASAAVFPTAFTEGQKVTVKVSADGSAAATRWIVINDLSANIVDNKGSAVPASWMVQDGIYDLVYEASASAFVLMNTEIPAAGITIADASSNFSATEVEAALAELAEGGVKVTKIKQVTTSRASDTTYSADPELAGWAVAAASFYSINGFLNVYQNTGDFKFRFTVSNANQVEKQHWDSEDENAVTATDFQLSITGGTSITTMTDADQYGIRIKGSFQTHATLPSTLDFQWAQSSAEASATNLLLGSWIEIAKLA
jgi:hypothetical protein